MTRYDGRSSRFVTSFLCCSPSCLLCAPSRSPHLCVSFKTLPLRRFQFPSQSFACVGSNRQYVVGLAQVQTQVIQFAQGRVAKLRVFLRFDKLPQVFTKAEH